ncbi:hypothetical protein DWZ98_02100 [Dorea formicigenerans]|uniref:Uncharacterized protein n=1 Tax=Dorea formicigenerans TaxID=39486 RepID=A0A415N6A1_9FIRM|nr:hypothetical protein [Dorea formicigenerans]RGK34571.1 hypothetical protein DXD18_03560 [Dorea formicigenerans]RHK60938.1 hypothetical protein DW054_13390 [Dorea formicigenerans]RHL90927.1 hypothetical protein DWZ98_02100 [Dorea formicigenerans]
MKDINSEELLLRQGKVPTGEIAVGEYDYHTSALPVIVYNIANFNFVLGEYHIHVYAVNTDGQQYFLGEGMGSVQ